MEGELQKAKKVRKPSRAKLEHYRRRVAENEARLRSGTAADGAPLTELQRANLETIIEIQRGHLLELSGNEG